MHAMKVQVCGVGKSERILWPVDICSKPIDEANFERVALSDPDHRPRKCSVVRATVQASISVLKRTFLILRAPLFSPSDE